MRRELLRLVLTCPVVLAILAGGVAAQDGPLLPGFEETPAVESAAGEPTENAPTTVVLPPGDDIRPLDAQGNPQTGPDEGVLELPEPPVFEPQLEERPQGEPKKPEPPRKNLWQKSTDALRGLTKPEPKPAAKPTTQNSSDAVRNWQMLRRKPLPKSTGPTGNVPGAQRMPQPQSPQPPSRGAIGVEAQRSRSQAPSGRRQVATQPTERSGQPRTQAGKSKPPKVVDNSPRSPWERSGSGRLRPAAPPVKASPAQGTGTRSSTYRSAQGSEAGRSK